MKTEETTLNILHLEDDPNDAELIRSILEEEGVKAHLFCVEKRAEFREALKKGSFDIIFADYSLPDFDGMAALKIAKQIRPELPFIFVSGTLGEELAIESLKSGATDYVLKQRLIRLVPSLNRALEEVKEREKREKAEQNLSRLASVVQQAIESIIITDLQGNIEYINPAFEKCTGYSVSESLGQNPRFLKSGKHNEDFYKDLWERISSGETWVGTFINKRKDGTFFQENAVIFPIRNNHGEVINYAAVKRDITAEKELEGLLRQTQKLEAIGQLTGGIAHDFNNILSVIIGYSELVLLKIDSTHLLFKNISEISKAGKKAVSLIRRLLAFSRRQVIEPKIININELIIALEKMLHRLIGEDITIDLLLSDKCDNIKADPGQIEQILINLIVNARDAINDKSPQIFEKKITIETSNVYLNNRFVSLHPESRKGQHIDITITDTGIGMDEKTRLNIFEPFFTTKEEGAGTGLGLSTVYGIVKQNNGSISVNSAPGRGTTFKIYWPVCEQKKDFRVDLIEDSSLIRGKEIILLVEDEESVRNFTKEALESMGYIVNSTSNGHEALAFIRKNNTKIDLLISDVIMPKMGGVELADNLDKLLPGLKTLFVSGYIDDKIVKNGILKKNVNFLQKPFSVHSLAKKVNEVLQN